jgi:hypothetical protein
MHAVSSATITPSEATETYAISEFIGTIVSPSPTPDHQQSRGFQAFLVEQRFPELRAHFHEVDQFQIVVNGSGHVGRDRVEVGAIHYTDGYTTYGPIRTELPVGIHYLTLRARPTLGINYMPESRAKRSSANRSSDHFVCAVDMTRRGTEPELVRIGRSRRNACAYAGCLPPGSALAGKLLESLSPCGYLVVLSGAARVGQVELPPKSVVSFGRPSELSDVNATAAGATVAVVTFADKP